MNVRFDDWEGEHLEHYGVLGMKWGQRRYQNKDGSLTKAGQRHYEKTGEYGYTYKSHATKKYTKKAAKAEAKLRKDVRKNIKTTVSGNEATTTVKISKKSEKLGKKVDKYKARAERSAELDKREQEYAQRVRTGGNLIARALTSGVIGGKAYQQHLAMNKDTKTTGSKVTSAVVANVFGRAGSAVRKANYIRQDEKAAKRAAKGKSADRGAAFRERAAAAKATFESGVNKAAGAVKSEYNKQKKKQKRS